jgi:hypothetical protein
VATSELQHEAGEILGVILKADGENDAAVVFGVAVGGDSGTTFIPASDRQAGGR